MKPEPDIDLNTIEIRSSDDSLIRAMRILAEDANTEEGLLEAVLLEAAQRIAEYGAAIDWLQRNAARRDPVAAHALQIARDPQREKLAASMRVFAALVENALRHFDPVPGYDQARTVPVSTFADFKL